MVFFVQKAKKAVIFRSKLHFTSLFEVLGSQKS